MGITDLHRAATRNFYRLTFEQQLDHLCNKWEVSPVGYFEDARGRIYVAEGWLARRPEDGMPGWTVLWAIRRRGPCIGQPIYMATAATRDQRMRAALSAALSFMGEEDGERVRRAG